MCSDFFKIQKVTYKIHPKFTDSAGTKYITGSASVGRHGHPGTQGHLTGGPRFGHKKEGERLWPLGFAEYIVVEGPSKRNVNFWSEKNPILTFPEPQLTPWISTWIFAARPVNFTFRHGVVNQIQIREFLFYTWFQDNKKSTENPHENPPTFKNKRIWHDL